MEDELLKNEADALNNVSPKKQKFEWRYSVIIIVITLLIWIPTSWSLHFWNSSREFFRYFFYFPFYLLPADFFISKGGYINFPNPVTVIPAIVLCLFVIYLYFKNNILHN